MVASGGRYLEKDERDIPDTFMMMVDYPSEHTVMLISVMTNDGNLPMVIRGQYGTLDVEPSRSETSWGNGSATWSVRWSETRSEMWSAP